jgi:addiction module HigA family antidote
MSQWSITTESVEVETMARKRTLQPVNPIHPGEMLLEEFLLPAGKTQAAFAREVGWTKARLNELIKGKRGVTAEAALDLAEALGTSPRLWMNLQATFDLDEATRKRRAA